MADNRDTQSATPATLASGNKIALYEIATFSGDSNALAAPAVLTVVSGAEGSRALTEMTGDGTNGLDVDVTRVQGTVTVTGPLTDTQIRASALPVSAASLPLPTGASTEATLSSLNAKVTAVNTGAVVVSSSALPSGASTSALQTTGNTSLSNIETAQGAQADAAASSDTGTFSLLAFVKRGLQNWTTILARIPALVGGYIPVTIAGNVRASFGAKAPVSITLTSLGIDAARQSAVLDFTSSGAIDALLRVTTNGTAGGTARLDLYAYSALGDSSYTDGASGTDTTFTAANRLNSRYVGFVQMNGATAVTAMFSLAAAFDGTLPSKVGLIAINKSLQALSATGGDHVVEVQTMVLAA